MKQIWISLFYFLISFGSCCQQFEVLYDYSEFSNDGGAIVKMEGGYFTTHLATDPLLGYTTLVVGFDEEGTPLWDTSLSDPTKELGQSNWNVNILSTSNSAEKWVIGNFVDPEDDSRTAFLHRFSTDGQPLVEIILDTLFDQRPDVWGGFITVSGIYLLCRDNTLDGNDEILIAKCSLDGQYLWHHTYDTGLTFNPKCIVDVGDGFIVGGSRYATLTDQGNGDGQQYIRKFDYAGESQWINTLAFDGNINLGAVGIVRLENGNYLFAGTKHIDNVSIQPFIGELDAATGDTIWTRLYFDSAPFVLENIDNFNSINRVHGFKKLSDGGYLGVGECRIDIIEGSFVNPLDNAAFLMKLDSEFNLIWKRVYVPQGYAELASSPAQCQLNDFVENDDGSITALGRVYMYTGSGQQGGYIQDSYLLRLDSVGCLLAGCSVGITEFEIKQKLLVYPNPAMNSATVEFSKRDNWEVEIYDCQGELVSKEQYVLSPKSTLDVSNLSSGLYTIKCKGTNGILLVEKLVKL